MKSKTLKRNEARLRSLEFENQTLGEVLRRVQPHTRQYKRLTERYTQSWQRLVRIGVLRLMPESELVKENPSNAALIMAEARFEDKRCHHRTQVRIKSRDAHSWKK